MASVKQNAGAAMEDLGQELLAAIFVRMGPSPMHLAALPCVCKHWRRIMDADVWRQLCLEVAPGFCKSMWYSGTLAVPTGGWSGVYKFLLYCPGLETSASRKLSSSLFGVHQSILGHMHETASGFQTGPQIIKDLGLEDQCFAEDFFVTAPCLHEQQIQQCGSVGLLGMVFRGVIRHFQYSAIARRIGAGAYLNTSSYEQKQMQEIAEDQCTYCRAPFVRLPPALFENPICDTESLPPGGDLNFQQNEGKGVTVSGYCCLNGHLIGLYDGWDGGRLLRRDVLPGSGAGLSVETCRIGKVLSSALAPNPGNCNFDLTVRTNLDGLSAARKVKRLADGIEKGEGEVNLFDSEVEEWPAGDVQTESEYLIRARQVVLDCREDWIDAHFKAEQYRMSAQESAEEVEITMSDDTPFWTIDAIDLARIKNLVDNNRKAEGVFLEYLKRKEQPASITLEHIRHLQLHSLRSQELEDARKKLIATALAALGVKVAARGRLRGQWPDPPSVENFIKLGDRSVYEVVMCQKSVLQERKLAAAARRKPTAKLEARGKVSG